MLRRISLNLSKRLVALGADKSKTAIYAYGLECLLSTAIILLIQFLGGIMFGCTLGVLIFTAFWLPLRILTGGFHANTHIGCTIISVGLCIFSVTLTDYINRIPAWAIATTMIFSYYFVFSVAPVVHKNHPISTPHRLKMRRVARVFATIEMLLIGLLYYIGYKSKSAAFMGFFSTAVLAVIGYFSKNTVKTFNCTVQKNI